MSSRRSEGYRDDRGERVRYDDRYVEREVEYSRPRPPPAVLERDREEIRFREDVRVPAYLQEGPRRGPGAPMVLRAREVEDFDFATRRRSPSPERKVERESITIRRDREESRSPLPPPPPPQERQREEIVIRREEVDDDTRSRRSYRPREYTREEVVIKRDESEPAPRRSDYGLQRPVSRERERSTVRRERRGSESEDEIIIRRGEREGRRGEREREEIIIRHRSRSRSSSPARSVAPPEPQIINAPPIHQEIITHHRHVDHGYEIAIPARPPARPPSPPSPPPEKSKERISIHRSGERDGRAYHDDVTIDRVEGGHGPPRPRLNNELARPPARAPQRLWDDVDEEAEYYDSIAKRRSHMGEAYHGHTRDWELVDIPPGTERVRMDGVGGASQEITWQRYNGARRSKFYPDGEEDSYASYEVEREPRPQPRREPSPEPERPAEIGSRYGRARNPTDRLWTEVTKDLVVKEAIQEMGYEFEETEEFYYIIAYLKYEDISRLVGLSEDIRKDRRKRVKEIEWENRLAPEPEEEPKKPLEIEPPPPRSKSPWNTENERYIEREIIYRGGRPPPPPGWRR